MTYQQMRHRASRLDAGTLDYIVRTFQSSTGGRWVATCQRELERRTTR